MGRTRRSYLDPSLARWLLAASAVALQSPRSGAADGPGRDLAASAASIEVVGGRATISIGPEPAGAHTLVVVGSIAREGGPFAVKASAKATGEVKGNRLASFEAIRRSPPSLPPVPPAPPPSAKFPPSRRTFYLLTGNGDPAMASSYRPIPSKLRAIGKRVAVYVDADDEGRVDPDTLRGLVEGFDEKIWPAASGRFGPATDVDRDGRFAVLFSGWLGRLAGGKVSVDGFVRGADLDPNMPVPFGNRADMMYLNASMTRGPYLLSVVAHEYMHAITFSRKVFDPAEAAAGQGRGVSDPPAEEEGWLDEAIAHLMEDAMGFSRANLDYRVSAYLSQPERYRLVVDDYYSAGLFRSHGNRGATYLFLRYCVDRYGPGLLDLLVRSRARGIDNLEAATGASFSELFRRWTVANYVSGLDPGARDSMGYRSVDLRGKFEGEILAGPRGSSLPVDGRGQAWLMEPTSAHYLVVEPRKPGAPRSGVRVEIEGAEAAQLQVTVVSLPSGMARPELVVHPSTAIDGSVRVWAKILEAGGSPIRLDALAWERLIPSTDRRSKAFERGQLGPSGMVDRFGASSLPANGLLRSRPILLGGVGPEVGPLVFKATGTDAEGRRVAAWAVVEPAARLDDAGDAPRDLPRAGAISSPASPYP